MKRDALQKHEKWWHGPRRTWKDEVWRRLASSAATRCSYCPGGNSRFWLLSTYQSPYQSAIENRFTVEDATV